MVTKIANDGSDDTSVIAPTDGLSWENMAFPIMVVTDDRFSHVPLLRVCARAHARLRNELMVENASHLSSVTGARS